MSRYIDADALIEKIKRCLDTEWDGGTSWKRAYSEFIDMIDDMPTADVVEVVRCKDCKHAEIQDYAPPSCRYCCKYSALYHAKNFYCSMGERREDDKE